MNRMVIAFVVGCLFAPTFVRAQVPVKISGPVVVYTPDPRTDKDYLPTYEEVIRRQELRLSLNKIEKKVLEVGDAKKRAEESAAEDAAKAKNLADRNAAVDAERERVQKKQADELQLSERRKELEAEYDKKRLELIRSSAPKKRAGGIDIDMATTSTKQR